MGEKNISDDHFNEVLKIACLDNFVNELKNKEHTIIGDNGKQISGGQKTKNCNCQSFV